MLHCSKCTGVTVVMTTTLDHVKEDVKKRTNNQPCLKCKHGTPFICDKCFTNAAAIIPVLCYMCTSRPHICLSKCAAVCVARGEKSRQKPMQKNYQRFH
jgi:hypothetical protein